MTEKIAELKSLFKPPDVVAISKEYPLLWERAVTADTRERLGQSVEPLDAECDAVLREIWMARDNAIRLKNCDAACWEEGKCSGYCAGEGDA